MGAGSYVGIAGHYVSALLQTAGLYAQGQIIGTFTDFFIVFGALMFILSFVSALISGAVFSDFRQGAILLVAPGIFFFLIYTTVEVDAVRYQYGDRFEVDITDRLVGDLSASADMSSYSQPARVSWFFSRYDALVSYIAQRMVTVFVDTANRQEITIEAREQVLDRLLRARGSNPQYLQLLSVKLFGECNHYMDKSFELAQLRRTSRPQTLDQRAQLDADIESLETNIASATVGGKVVYIERELSDYIQGLGIDHETNMTCQELWGIFTQITRTVAGNELTPTGSEIAAFCSDANTNITSCQSELDTVFRQVEDRLSAESGGGRTAAVDALSAYYLKNTLNNSAHNRLMSAQGSRNDWSTETIDGFRDIAGLGTEISTLQAELRYFHFAIPYWQGVFLYFLTMAFPFFAIMLLVPGRAGGFFIWCSLWAWVKSWDVGFAILYQVRDTLWQVLPNLSGGRFIGDFSTIDWSSPGGFLENINDVEAQMSYAIYLGLMSFFTLSVPLITAQLFKGARDAYYATSEAFTGKMNAAGGPESFGQDAGRTGGRVGGDMADSRNRNAGIDGQAAGVNTQTAGVPRNNN